MYEYDKDHIERVIGVHFPKNDNSKAEEAIGIEIEITKKNNLTVIESVNSQRYKVIEYDPKSNFSKVVPFTDEAVETDKDGKVQNQNYKDLLSSEIYELKNLWYNYNKHINQLLMLLPQEVLTRYDMVVKHLSTPIFDVSKYENDADHL